jgi:hypothetical protein
MASITLEVVAGAPDNSNAIFSHLTARSCHNPVLSLSSVISIQYAFSMSNSVKYLFHAISDRLLLISGMGYTRVIATIVQLTGTGTKPVPGGSIR